MLFRSNIERESGAFADVNTATKANPTIPDTYSVITENAQGGQESVGTGNYSAIKNGFTLKAGTGYKMSAFNVTEAVAESSNGGNGEARYFGSSSFNVIAGQTADVNFVCTMVNAQVAIDYDESFSLQFSDYSVELSTAVNTNRVVVMPATADLTAPIAFFNVNDTNPTLSIKIKGTRLLDSELKEFNQTIQLAAKTWHKLTIKATTVAGSVGVDITVDNSVITSSTDINIDPYN